jgi:hypothetical protein
MVPNTKRIAPGSALQGSYNMREGTCTGLG